MEKSKYKKAIHTSRETEVDTEYISGLKNQKPVLRDKPTRAQVPSSVVLLKPNQRSNGVGLSKW